MDLKAVCVLKGTSEVSGTVFFTQEENGPVKVTGIITGLSPGDHGCQIHEFGDNTNGCGSAGQYSNPFNKTHGAQEDDNRHVGDQGNMNANENGIAEFDLDNNVITLSGPNSIIGRTMVIHEKADDLGKRRNEESLKTGNAGGHLACGVIGIAQC
ncbi:superoxide dismutase [Cu-Zn] [Erpetoichthys calabaricus]|uniref:superoxide dismutase n=1 Tax=Erpetoichthys calabaricus TaxID=27687 RepID=A0A8C4SDN1_ERPCA|nr:superoxide dismutase [Cu-Zn] [Erpetoichthys calabaricus]